MKEEYLHIKITEAIDGTLSSYGLRQLEAELEKYPELKEAYEMLKDKPDIEQAFPLTEPDPHDLNKLREKMLERTGYVYPQWLPAYLTAAAVVLIVLAGIIRYEVRTAPVDDVQAHEWLHEPNEMLAWNESDFIFLPELEKNGQE